MSLNHNPNPSNITYISSATTPTYNIMLSDDVINVDTSSGAISIYLPNIKNSGLDGTPKRFYINDTGGASATNNITIYGIGGNLINGTASTVIDSNGANTECVIASKTEWLINKSYDSGGGDSGGIFEDGTMMNDIFVENTNIVATTDKAELFEVRLSNRTNITGISAPNLTSIGYNITINDNPIYTSTSLPVLETIVGSLVYTGNSNTGNINLSINSLISVGSQIQIGTCVFIQTVSFSSLESANLIIDSNASLSSLNLSSLQSSSGIQITSNGGILNISLSALTELTGGLTISSNSSLNILDISNIEIATVLTIVSNLIESIDLSSLIEADSVDIEEPNCTSVLFNNTLNCLNITVANGALTEASVDDILDKIDEAGYEDGSLNLSGGTNAIPSAAGLTSKANLEGKGWTVTVNS